MNWHRLRLRGWLLTWFWSTWRVDWRVHHGRLGDAGWFFDWYGLHADLIHVARANTMLSGCHARPRDAA